jgi:uncharacterized membrane protein
MRFNRFVKITKTAMRYNCYHWMKLIGAILLAVGILLVKIDLGLEAAITIVIAALLGLAGIVGQLMQAE